MKSRVQDNATGEIIVVEHSAGASPDEIKRLARARVTPAPARAATRPTPGPDIVGRAHRALTAEPPAGARTALSRKVFGEQIGSFDYPGRLVRAAGDLFLPATIPEAASMAATLPVGGPIGKTVLSRVLGGNVITGPLKRVAAGGLAGAGTALAQGRDWASSLMEGGRQGLSQFAGELLPGALRFGLTQKKGARLLADREARAAHDRAMHEAVGTLESAGYKGEVATRRADEVARVREARAQYQEQVRDVKARHEAAQTEQARGHAIETAAAKAEHEAAQRAFAEHGAETIAESFKAQVSAFRDYPSNEEGLLRMVSGDGPQRLSAVYDAVMKEIAHLGKARAVEIPLKDAQALGIRFWDVRGTKERGLPDVARVDASQLAEAATGFWKKNRGVYERAVRALDALDIGDPAARGEYRAGRALLDFAESSQMLKGQRFNPDAARAAFDRVKKLDTLRRRGQGDMFSGPIAEAVRRRPAPATFAGRQAGARPGQGVDLYTLTAAIPGHPSGSTVSGRTLREAGYDVPLQLPLEPTPLTPPQIPAFRRPAPLPEVPPPPRRVLLEEPPPEGVTFRTLPKMGFWQGAAIAEIPFLVEGLTTGKYQYGYGLPVAVGGLVSSGLSGRRLITRVPETPLSKFAASVVPPLAQEVRRQTRPGALTIQPGEGPSTAEIDRLAAERRSQGLPVREPRALPPSQP